MLHWWCITSAGNITMSAVLSVRNDTFMCEAIKSDEVRPGGIGRIYNLCISLLTLSPWHHSSISLSLSFSLFLSSVLNSLPHLEHYCCSSFSTLPRTHTYKTLLSPFSPFFLSLCQSFCLSPRDHICVTWSSLSVSLNPALPLGIQRIYPLHSWCFFIELVL